MSAIATVRAAPGLDDYLDQLEDRLAEAVAARPGLVAEIGAEALSSGGKRLRPLLVFLTAAPDDEPPLAAGVAIELVHMASLVHDDLIDGAELRRGRASVWSAYGPDAASAGGVYLFRPRLRRARCDRRRRGGRHPRRLRARTCPRRGTRAGTAASSRHDR